jgi:MFS family permease
MEDIRVRLSVLWLFATLNYIYADVFFCVDVLGSNREGPSVIHVIHFSPAAWLGVAILMEIPMAMILLSRILKPRANRWANIVAGIIETAAVLLTSFILPILKLTETSSYYLFFGTIEVACTSLIVWYAWRWPRETAHRIEPSGQPLPLAAIELP